MGCPFFYLYVSFSISARDRGFRRRRGGLQNVYARNRQVAAGRFPMAANVENKYYLKTVHEEIGLFDRKLAHLLKHEVFDNEEARDAATRKLMRKRETLVETAKRMAAEGIEFKTSELPKSLLPEGTVVEAPEPVVDAATEAAPAAGQVKRSVRRQASAYAGTSLDWETSIRDYMSNKKA